jgi:hypothetical protein
MNLGKESGDMRTALGWMNVEWYTFYCVCEKSYFDHPQFILVLLQVFFHLFFKKKKILFNTTL